MKKSSVLLAGLLMVGTCAQATLKLPGFFSDNMVLQREIPVPVWGWETPGTSVKVQFGEQVKTAIADESGRWEVRLDPLPASAEARVLDVNNGAVLLKNIVVGDVWICSGQSNMEWPVVHSHDAAGEIAKADYPLIRHMKIEHQLSDFQEPDVSAQWQVCQPATVSHFTAVGYYFARRLRKELDVPVGLIGSNWGGTRIEPWIPAEGFRAVPQLAWFKPQIDLTDLTIEKSRADHVQAVAELRKWVEESEKALARKEPRLPPRPRLPSEGGSHQDPMRIYNKMIHPLIPYAIRGAIWYQGESNGGEGIEYFHKKRALIEGWRGLWDQGDFPFYFVQLAAYNPANDNPVGGDGLSRIREAQRKCLEIPNTGMAVITDIGNATDIHPKNKQDVGSRLAQWALAKEFGQDIVPSGPLLKSMQIQGKRIRISFDHVGAGLMVGKKEVLKPYEPVEELSKGELKRFAIAGADKVWHWATAEIDRDSVVVSSPDVSSPIAVRYAYSSNPEGANLYNREGLPASPFRTDDW